MSSADPEIDARHWYQQVSGSNPGFHVSTLRKASDILFFSPHSSVKTKMSMGIKVAEGLISMPKRCACQMVAFI